MFHVHCVSVQIFRLCNTGSGRADKLYRFKICLSGDFTKLLNCLSCLLIMLTFGKHHHHLPVRRIMQHLPESDFLAIKTVIILRRRCLYTIMLRLISLDNNLSGPVSPSGSSRRLGQQLKCSLRGLIIPCKQRQIRSQNTNQCHIGKIMSFDNHLGTDQNIRTALRKSLQDPAHVILA